MKKTIGIFSLSMVLFSTFAPSFTYATGEVEETPSEQEAPIVTDNPETPVEPEAPAEPEAAPEILTESGTIISEETTGSEDPKIQETSTEEGNGEDDQSITEEIKNFENLISSEEGEQNKNLYVAKTFEECAKLVNDNTYLSEYYCDGEINIPSYVTMIVGNNTFGGLTISGFNVEGNISVSDGNLFSGATIIGEITINIDNNHYYNYASFDRIIIGENGKLTVNSNTSFTNSFNRIEVEEGGELIINTSNGGGYGILSHSIINGKVTINTNGLENSGIGISSAENSEIIIGGTNTEIKASFNNSNFNGKLTFNNGIEEIKSGSFNNSNIATDIKLPNSVKKVDSSFSYANMTGNLLYSGNDLFFNSFYYGEMHGDIIITGTNLVMRSNTFNNGILDGNFKCIDCNTTSTQFQYENNRDYAFNKAQILGDFIINSQNGDINLRGWNLGLSSISGDVILSGANINLSTALNTTQIDGSLILNGGYLETSSAAISNMNIGNNLEINVDEFNSTNGGITKNYITGDIIINGNNVIFNGGSFTYQNAKNIIINANILTGEAGALTWNNTLEDYIISGGRALLQAGSAGNSKIGRDFKIYFDHITGLDGGLARETVTGNVIISGNSLDFMNYTLNESKIRGNLTINGIHFTGDARGVNASDGIFNDLSVSGDINILGDNTYISGAFINLKVGGDLTFGANNTYVKGFTDSLISGNIITYGNEIKFEKFKPLALDGNFECKNTNKCHLYNFFADYYDIPNTDKKTRNIGGDIIINSKNIIGEMYTLEHINLGGGLNISGDNFLFECDAFYDINMGSGIIIDVYTYTGKNQSFSNLTVGGNVIINANNIYTTSAHFSNSQINGDFSINSKNSLNMQTGTFNSLTITKNLNINGNTIRGEWGSLNAINVYKNTIVSGNNTILSHGALGGDSTFSGNLRLPKNLELGNYGPLKQATVKSNLILGGSKTIIPNELTLNGGLIIEDGNEAIPNIFTGLTIGNNQVTINGTLSNIGAHAYSFKEGTRIINTITLSDDFSTGDIGDGAFCIQNEPDIKVNAISAKKFTQEERQDLYDRTCINLAYSGTYNLLLKVDGREAIAVYDGIHEVEIPDGLKKSGYNIKWYSNPELTGEEANLNNQTFEEFEYTKTIYGKYVEIPVTPASGGGSTINPSKQESKMAEQEHNSADTEKSENTKTDNVKSSNSTVSESIKEQVVKAQERSLTRGEVAVMTNILLDVYPQLTENRELNEVSEACENYADEQNFTKDEKKAITRLCKLSIMGIHADNEKPLDEFMVNEITKNAEFSKVINRSLSTYTEKDFSVVKDALKKLEGDEENVVFGTVYEVFMSIKNIFN